MAYTGTYFDRFLHTFMKPPAPSANTREQEVFLVEYTLRDLEEYAAKKAREQRNSYNARHPEKVLEQRIRTAANLLRRHGYSVTLADPAPENMEGARHE